MPHAEERVLKFSLGRFLSVKYLEAVKDFFIADKTIVLNVDNTSAIIARKPLEPWNSSIYTNTNISSANSIVCITMQADFFSCSSFPQKATIEGQWTQMYIDTLRQHPEDTVLWRSEKEKVNNIEFNLWYAPAGTNCGIHNEHGFRELHTQVFGTGQMQKFHKNKYESFYQSVFMSPGYTHEPFYNEAGIYPWHQYYADTDCVWLASEF